MKSEIEQARDILRAALEASGGGPLDEDETLVTMAERAALHLDGWRSAAAKAAQRIRQIVEIPAQTPERARIERVGLELVTELERARAIHGDQIKLPISHRPTEWSVIGLDLEITARLDLDKAPSWAAILLEEVGGTLGAMDDPEALRAELVQVGAMTIGMIRRLDTP